MILDHAFGVTGHFDLKATSPEGASRPLASFPNMVLDNGINRWMVDRTLSSLMAGCSVGTSNTPPAASQTSLVSRVGHSYSAFQTETKSYVGGATPYYEFKTYIRFPAGTATGNLSEIGMGPGNEPNNLFSRALIVDAQGNPTTITVLANEALDVTYTVRLYLNVTPATGTFVLDGTTHTFTILPYLSTVPTTDEIDYFYRRQWLGDGGGGNLSTWANITALGAYDVIVQGSTVFSSSWSVEIAPYTAGNLYRDRTLTSAVSQIPTGTLAGIAPNYWAGTSAGARMKLQFSPAIPFDVTQRLSVTIRVSLARHTP